jgi:hypothetical protein
VISPYTADEEGDFCPELPRVCPLQYSNKKECKIKISHHRVRKTGPCFPLFVMVCKEHNIGFTLYPPGYYPYSRHTLAAVSPEGIEITEKAEGHRLSGTIFDAAIDAAAKVFWCKESMIDSLTPRLWTQKYHLKRISRLLGIETDFNKQHREVVSQILMVPGQFLHDCAVALKNDSSIVAKGSAILKIINQIPCFSSLFERLVEIGANAGLWPSALFSDPVVHSLHHSQFYSLRTRGSPSKNGADC